MILKIPLLSLLFVFKDTEESFPLNFGMCDFCLFLKCGSKGLTQLH